MSKLAPNSPTPSPFTLSEAKGLAFDDPKHHLYHGDCLDLLAQIPESSVDLVFADPPYFLSNGGIMVNQASDEDAYSERRESKDLS